MFQEGSIFSVIMSKIGDFVVLNVLFIVTCIPVFTIGTSCCALYHSMNRCIIQDYPYPLREYMKAWKENFSRATVLWLFCAAAALAMGLFTRYFIFHMDNFAVIVSYIICFIAFTFSVLFIFPQQATFINTPAAIIKNSFLFALQKLPLTLLLYFATWLPVVITWKLPQLFYITILYWIFAGFSVCALFSVLITRRIFKRYMPEPDGGADETADCSNASDSSELPEITSK
ncbi:MAG: YesL family protein [Lachnospiraceae bacterium]|nr:YesL family protein [Lachnospiraceae bacterium]